MKFDGESSVEVPRTNWPARVDARLQQVVVGEVSLQNVSYNPQTRQVAATVRATFVANTSGDQRLNLWVVEDAVYGAGSGYNQVNYYNTVVGHAYYGAGNPILNFRHDGVVRAMLAGPWGQVNSVAPTVVAGETYSQVFGTQLPIGVNANNVRLIGVLQGYDDADITKRNIINATEMELMPMMRDGFE